MKSKVNPRLLIVLGIALLLLVGFGAVQVLGGGEDAPAETAGASAEDSVLAGDSDAQVGEPADAAGAAEEQPIDGTPVVADPGADTTDWASQANVICERAASDLAGQAALTTEADAAEALAEARGIVDELAALAPPVGAEAEAAEFVALLSGALDAADQLVALGEQGDLEQLGSILQEQAAAQARLIELAGALGVEPCVGGSSVDTEVVASDDIDPQAGVAGLLELQNALRDKESVVLVVYSPKGELDTRVVREARAGANGSGAGFVSVDGTREAQIKVLAEAFDLRETPATLVVNRGLIVASRFSGFADRETVAQAVKDALEAS